MQVLTEKLPVTNPIMFKLIVAKARKPANAFVKFIQDLKKQLFTGFHDIIVTLGRNFDLLDVRLLCRFSTVNVCFHFHENLSLYLLRYFNTWDMKDG